MGDGERVTKMGRVTMGRVAKLREGEYPSGERGSGGVASSFAKRS